MSTASSVTRIDGSHPTRLNKEADIGKPPPLLRGVYGPYVLLPLIAALVWLGGSFSYSSQPPPCVLVIQRARERSTFCDLE